MSAVSAVGRLPFVDTHIHFHDMSHPRLRYEWLAPETPIDPVVGPDDAIKCRRYWADDFLAEVRFQNVTKVVHVQAAIGADDPVEETRWLSEFAARLGVPHGIVAYADLAAPDAADMLARHAEFPLLRGIRDLRYDGYLTDEAWLRGYAMLERHGLVCCDDPFLEEMGEARRLAERFPGIVLCIDHGGYPGYGGNPRVPEKADFEQWRAGMRAIGGLENTVVKISGLGMSDHQWTPESIRPWVLECIEAFGTDRAFFGTNWPVDRLYSSYGDVLDAYAAAINDFSPAEQQALFSGNAERIFRL